LKKHSVIDDKEKLLSWYADNPSEYGNLWEPTISDGTRVEVHIPRMIALPLRAASLYHQFKGAVMPHKLLNAIKQHLTSPDTSLSNASQATQRYQTASDKSRYLPQQWGRHKNDGYSWQHRKMAEGGTSQSPNLIWHYAQTPSCPTMT
jgi:hypothetical protein